MVAKEIRPETITLATRLWVAALMFEGLHQIINTVLAIHTRDHTVYLLQERYRENDSQPLPSSQLVEASVVGASVITAIVAFVLIGVMAKFINKLYSQSQNSSFAHRALIYFGIYLGIRMLMVFAAEPGAMVPIGVYAFDGSLQILVGILAALATYFATRPDACKWTGTQLLPKQTKK
ncbi:hypothetical protein [Corynebacterium sp. HS2168-gen11]|uniref:hypothetical protein n=1 Tax=Corynebacterium sp. HS2168-gen11 TaxID=2974027 RepID=UPI00216B21BF|nr:hypothetical protein [Corynebacterium sp. HS2168-gen11]MCS4535766.1 hypothetical protein [Corynebacterium sp. HS2168-gen11]